MAMNSLIVWTRSMESNYTLNIYPSAQLDLDKIFAYIYKDLSNPKAAIDLIYAFREAFDNLRYFPESNPLVYNEYVKDKSLRKLLIKNYIAFYRISGYEIQIVRVLYGMSNYQILL